MSYSCAILKQDDWCLYANPAQADLLADVDDIPGLIKQLEALPNTLKNNHRSHVLSGQLNGRHIVAKRPIDKNRRKWARFSSLLVSAEALATLQNLARFEEFGVESVKPLFALEQRRFGMVVDSWICYEFRAGEPCGELCIDKTASLLQSMHKAGFRHDDPHSNNFLMDDCGTLFTIDCKGRARRGVFSDTTDFALFKRVNGLDSVAIHELGNISRLAPGYWLGMLYISFKAGRAKLRDRIKRNRPKNTESS